MNLKGRKILVAMSGGVDSALAAAELRLAGAEVVGVHMRVWHYKSACDDDLNGKLGTCCSPADAMDARRVAEQFDFPFYSIDFETDFRRAVIEPFVGDYLAGLTPNPCVRCNSRLKLGTLLGKAKAWGCEAVATGHYARVVHHEDGRAELLRARDRAKDQSYYLFELTQAQLRHFMMPLGGMTKDEVRAKARALGMHLAEKPDSQDICFVEKGDYRKFLREEAGIEEEALAGAIVDTRGRELGRHAGVHRYTIGQRKGLGVSAERPLYVVDLQPETRTVVVGYDEETLAVGMMVRGMNWIAEPPAAGAPIRARVQIRYHHEPVPATVYGVEGASRGDAPGGGSGGGDSQDRIRIEFDEPQRAVTPGQAAVLYDLEAGESVLGGGWIGRGED